MSRGPAAHVDDRVHRRPDLVAHVARNALLAFVAPRPSPSPRAALPRPLPLVILVNIANAPTLTRARHEGDASPGRHGTAVESEQRDFIQTGLSPGPPRHVLLEYGVSPHP